MSKLNCPNCGAVISAETNKCPYCNTSYFDISSLDINNDEPFYLKIKYNNMIFTQLVRVVPTCNITFSEDYTYATGSKGQTILAVPTSRTMNLDLSFQAIPDYKGNLFKFNVQDTN